RKAAAVQEGRFHDGDRSRRAGRAGEHLGGERYHAKAANQDLSRDGTNHPAQADRNFRLLEGQRWRACRSHEAAGSRGTRSGLTRLRFERLRFERLRLKCRGGSRKRSRGSGLGGSLQSAHPSKPAIVVGCLSQEVFVYLRMRQYEKGLVGEGLHYGV